MLLANAGIPLIGFVTVLGWLAFPPVVLLETAMACYLLRWRVVFALKWVSLANAVSMILGIPVVWFLTHIAAFLTGGGGWGDHSVVGVVRSPAWFGPGYIDDLSWAVPLALVVLCVPFFLMSLGVEFLVLRRAAATAPGAKHSLWAYTWKANAASYALLVVLLLAAMIHAA